MRRQEANEAESAALLKRVKKMTADFDRDHPVKSRAMRFVDDLFRDAPSRGGDTLADRQHRRDADDLHVAFYQLFDMLVDAPSDIEEFIFDRLLKIMLAVHAIGRATAPEGRSGRQARSDQAAQEFASNVQIVQIYLSAHPELKKKDGDFPVSRKFAGRIRPHIVDAPSVTAIVAALKAIKGRTLSR